MGRASLSDFFAELAPTPGEFLIHDDGYRCHARTYAATARAARAFASRLRDAGVRQGDRMLLWGDNAPEWVVALWGALISGVVVVPLDSRSPRDFVERVAAIVDARLWVVDSGRAADAAASARVARAGRLPHWNLADTPWSADGPEPDVTIAPDDTAEIVFTSGATADPKGVVLTHRNILANLGPIEREIRKFRRYGQPFFPLRFLNLLPLSHMFGQTMATFIPPLLPGTTVFMRGCNPADIVRTIKAHRVSVLVCVPRVLEVLRTYVRHAAPSTQNLSSPDVHWVRRWWRHLDAHRQFGLKFWCAVVGGAPLDRDVEAFWSRAGFLVIQGYGLTETAPVVALNHPLFARRGSVGRPLEGTEVRLAPDGEILVRGDNVTRGYYNAPDATGDAFEDGWLKTGDVGEVDGDGRLFVRGRKKEMIVGPDGLNVFPPDVERVLNTIIGVRESAVVGRTEGSHETVWAVLVLDDGVDTEAVVAAANAALAPHQRLRGALRWPAGELPRTEGTGKLKRVAIGHWANGVEAPSAPAPLGNGLEATLGKYAHGRPVGPGTTLDDLGLTSLDRVELMVDIEQRLNVALDEQAFSAVTRVGDLARLIERDTQADTGGAAAAPFPAWNTSWPARAVRRAVLGAFLLPFARFYAPASVTGLDHVIRSDGPVIFAANHQSHMDTPAIMAALPASRRYRLAPAMAKEFFADHFHPEGVPAARRWAMTVLYYLVALCFNPFPLPQREAGSREALRYMGALASRGYSILIYPEGRRTDAGEIEPFRPGVGMMAARLDLAVIPIRLEGLDHVLHRSWNWPRRHRVRIAFGPPLVPGGETPVEFVAAVERAVREL